jgi:hypothetical protein
MSSLGEDQNFVKVDNAGVGADLHESIANIVRSEVNKVSRFVDPLSDIRWMWSVGEAEAKDALVTDNDVHVDCLEEVVASRVAMEAPETNKVVLGEELNLFACFLLFDIFFGKGMNLECLPQALQLRACRIRHVKPPNTSVRA